MSEKNEKRILGTRSRELSRLDNLITRFAKDVGLPDWTSGFSVRITEDDLYVDLSHIDVLQEALDTYTGHPYIDRIREGLQTLELIEIIPNYDEFTSLFEKKIEGLDKPKIVFILGAGASKPAPSNIPTINEMLNVIVTKLPPVENPMTNKIKEWASRGNINIEDIMTAGYISSNLVSDISIHRLVGEIIYRTPSEENRATRSTYTVPELRDVEYVISFKELVDRVFSIASGIMIQADYNEVHDSIAKLINNSIDFYEYSIITTNYDVCIEKALQKNNLTPLYLGLENKSGMPIIKIHGSLNWYYCEGCQDVIIYNIDELKKFTKMYPTTASCLQCNTLTQLFMIPPIAYKYVIFPPIVEIWQHAMNTLEEADIIIVIGYSFSLSDDYILKMIVNGLKRKSSLFVVLNNSRKSVISLQERLDSYHENIDISINEDANTSTPIICKIIEEST